MTAATTKTGLTVREVIQQLIAVEDLDRPFLIGMPKVPAEDEGEEENRGIVFDADNTSIALFITETADGVVVSEQEPAE